MESNTSGHGQFAEVPAEVKKWNWGAFWLTWIWGIGNKSYIALLALLPVANLIMPFYLGAKGNELAWRNKEWYDSEELRKSQKSWAIAGWIIALIYISCMVGRGVSKYYEAKESEKITNEVVAILKENKEVEELIGQDFYVKYSFEYGMENQCISRDFIIESDKGRFQAKCEFEEDDSIKSMEVSVFGENNTSDKIIIRGINHEKEK